MISSTALDLPEHRQRVMDACLHEGIFSIGMEHLPARDASGIHVSLEMVDQADIYIGVYAWRYGWVPDFYNPDRISITEMEFNRALERKERGELKEILIFVMHDDHPIRASWKEDGEEAQRKLKEFKQRASAGRVMVTFESTQELRGHVIHALADLKSRLEPGPSETPPVEPNDPNTIPMPPAFYAEPDYIGSHKFVGRVSQLQELDDWARRADPTNLLLFEAIGGNGKSMLTWEWTTEHATQVRPKDDPWAGRFWYSFYERGAIMADFCQRALAYMTGQPLKELRKKKTAELRELLLAQLHAKPWLLILDGLERVLVAYHRIDAAEMPDEDANNPTDKIVNRNPCDAIRDEDNDLLRALAAAAPSKILVSSRLTPRVLLNPSGQPITGAKRITLPGLRPPDAEQLLRSCGIEGDSAAIQSYLTTNCDNHPLVIGILGGIIHNYLPARGNFDTWAADPDGGAKLDLASLDLIQRRNHILRAALDALPSASRQLLSTLALIPESVDYETLNAFNPHLPPEPKEVKTPKPPEDSQWRFDRDEPFLDWAELSDDQKSQVREHHEASVVRWQDYKNAVHARQVSAEFRAAPKQLEATVSALEQRGLLQWDARERRYSLHPVVHGVASGGMSATELESNGKLVVDYFNAQPHRQVMEIERIEDLSGELHVVRTLLKLGRFEQAANAFLSNSFFAGSLILNLTAYDEALSLLRPFFPIGWAALPDNVDTPTACTLSFWAAYALSGSGHHREALDLHFATIHSDLEEENWNEATPTLASIAFTLIEQNRLSKAIQIAGLAIELDDVCEQSEDEFPGRLALCLAQYTIGKLAEFGTNCQLLISELASLPNPFGLFIRDPSELSEELDSFVESLFAKGNLQEEQIVYWESVAFDSKNRRGALYILRMCGSWRLDLGASTIASATYTNAVRMARETGILDAESETGLALAKHHLGQLAEPQREAERLAQLRQPAHRLLAQLWLALGDPAQSKHHALAAYKWAWADGEPYVNRYDLTRTTELLKQMNVEIPNLPPYDTAKDEPFPWEADVRAAIEKLRAEKEAKEK